MKDIAYTVTVPDLEALLEHELRTTYRRRILRQSAITGLVIAGMAYAFLYSQFHHHVAAASVAAFFGLVLLLALPSVTRDQQRKALRKLFAGAGDTALGAKTLSVEQDGLSITGASSASQMQWSVVQRVATTPTHAFLFLGPLKAVVIPLGGIPAPERQELVSVLRSRATAGTETPETAV